MMQAQKIKHADIKIDGGTQSRAAIDQNIVAEYAEAMAEGAEFPPLVVFHDGEQNWLADGFHRLHAEKAVGFVESKCEVRQGARRDAILYSVGANDKHGLRRTNADKRRAVQVLLDDREWSKWSDREIARRCGVSKTFVAKLRPAKDDDTGNRCQYESEKTFTHPKTGKPTTMKTANIGRAPKRLTPEPNLPITEERLKTWNADVVLSMGKRGPTDAPAAPTKEPPKGDPIKGYRPSNGRQYSTNAIIEMQKIDKRDTQRAEAFEQVRRWLDANE